MDFSPIFENRQLYLEGLLTTVQLVSLSLVIGLALAVPLAILRNSPNLLVNGPVWTFTYFFRGTPLLVQMFMIYYGLGQLQFMIDLSREWTFLRDAYWYALLAFTLNTCAYTTEIIRGAIAGTPYGEIEAARTGKLPKLIEAHREAHQALEQSQRRDPREQRHGERELARDYLLSVAYVGSKSTHLPQRWDSLPHFRTVVADDAPHGGGGECLCHMPIVGRGEELARGLHPPLAGLQLAREHVDVVHVDRVGSVRRIQLTVVHLVLERCIRRPRLVERVVGLVAVNPGGGAAFKRCTYSQRFAVSAQRNGGAEVIVRSGI